MVRCVFQVSTNSKQNDRWYFGCVFLPPLAEASESTWKFGFPPFCHTKYEHRLPSLWVGPSNFNWLFWSGVASFPKRGQKKYDFENQHPFPRCVRIEAGTIPQIDLFLFLQNWTVTRTAHSATVRGWKQKRWSVVTSHPHFQRVCKVTMNTRMCPHLSGKRWMCLVSGW